MTGELLKRSGKYGGENSNTAEEVSKFQLADPREGIWSPKTRALT